MGTTGLLIVGDGSGGGGGQSSGFIAPDGGAGGGDNDTLIGSNYNDVIFGDGSGGGAGGSFSSDYGAGGLGGGGTDTLYGGTGNDILFGDGFNGLNSISYVTAGSNGGFGGGGGGGSALSYLYGYGFVYLYGGGGSSLWAGYGSTGNYTSGYSSMAAMKDGSGSYISTGGASTFTYGGGGGGFGDVGNGGSVNTAGSAGGTSVYSVTDSGGSIYNTVYYEVTAGNIYHSTAGTTNGYGAGNDLLDGGTGSDHYFGMGGADTFIVSAQDNAASDVDTIWDFSHSEGDKILLKDEGGNVLTSEQLNTLLNPTNGSITISATDTTLAMSNGSTLIVKGVIDLGIADFKLVQEGIYLVGDGSGGGGASGSSGGNGGAGGGGGDTLTGSNHNDIIFGDGSGGGAGGGYYLSGAIGGAGGGGADVLYGGNGNDILFGDGFNGVDSNIYGTYGSSSGGNGGLGGGGGGGTDVASAYPGGHGGLGGGDGAKGPNAGIASANGVYGGTGYSSFYGGGGGGFGGTGTGGSGTVSMGGSGGNGGTSQYSATDYNGESYNWLLSEVQAGNIFNSTTGTTNGYGAGNDLLDGGAGSDHYFGMGGSDTFVVSEQDNAATDVDTIWDFKHGDGDRIQLEDGSGNVLFTYQVNDLLNNHAVVGSDTTLTMSDGSQLIIKGVTNLTAADFLVACFLPGTQFETLDGMKAIEELQIGEMMKTAHGYAPLKWLAKRHVDWSMSLPRRVAPVLVKQGALGSGLPLRDLYVSPAHAFEIDGVLINAELLVNGSTIVQLLDYERDFTWYNIELESHSIVYAEGAAVESYLEVGDNRNSYDNAAEFHQLYPHHVVPEAMEMGRITLKRQMLSLRKAAA